MNKSAIQAINQRICKGKTDYLQDKLLVITKTQRAKRIFAEISFELVENTLGKLDL